MEWNMECILKQSGLVPRLSYNIGIGWCGHGNESVINEGPIRFTILVTFYQHNNVPYTLEHKYPSFTRYPMNINIPIEAVAAFSE